MCDVTIGIFMPFFILFSERARVCEREREKMCNFLSMFRSGISFVEKNSTRVSWLDSKNLVMRNTHIS